MPRRVHLALPLMLLLFALARAAAPDELERQRERLAHALDAGERAKITVKIGEELLERLTKAYKDGNSEKAAEWLAAYRDAVQTAGKGLLDLRRQEPRQLKGFKDLEIHLRKGMRHLRDIEHLVPLDELVEEHASRPRTRPGLSGVEGFLLRVDNDLVPVPRFDRRQKALSLLEPHRHVARAEPRRLVLIVARREQDRRPLEIRA